jgi:hypothetical protein
MRFIKTQLKGESYTSCSGGLCIPTSMALVKKETRQPIGTEPVTFGIWFTSITSAKLTKPILILVSKCLSETYLISVRQDNAQEI